MRFIYFHSSYIEYHHEVERTGVISYFMTRVLAHQSQFSCTNLPSTGKDDD